MEFVPVKLLKKEFIAIKNNIVVKLIVIKILIVVSLRTSYNRLLRIKFFPLARVKETSCFVVANPRFLCRRL